MVTHPARPNPKHGTEDMPEADTLHIRYRRPPPGYLGRPPISPDAAILKLGTALAEALRREDTAWEAWRGANDDNGPRTRNAKAAYQRTASIIDQIERTPASTLPGLMIKLQALAWCRSGEPTTAADFIDLSDSPSTDIRLVAGLLNDLIRMHEGA